MELAANSSDGAFHGPLHRRPVLTLVFAGSRARLHALGRPCVPWRGPGRLCGGMYGWAGPIVGALQLSSRGFRYGPGQRRLAGNFLADRLVESDRSASGDFFPAKRGRSCPVAAGHPGHVRGMAAPLLTGVLLVVLALRLHFAGFTFLFVALPFLILFMAGVSADLLQSRYALLANAVIVGVLIANAMIDVYSLMHITSRSR